MPSTLIPSAVFLVSVVTTNALPLVDDPLNSLVLRQTDNTNSNSTNGSNSTSVQTTQTSQTYLLQLSSLLCFFGSLLSFSVVGPMTQTCTITLTPSVDSQGNPVVIEVQACTVTLANDNTSPNEPPPSSASNSTTTSSSSSSSSSTATSVPAVAQVNVSCVINSNICHRQRT